MSGGGEEEEGEREGERERGRGREGGEGEGETEAEREARKAILQAILQGVPPLRRQVDTAAPTRPQWRQQQQYSTTHTKHPPWGHAW